MEEQTTTTPAPLGGRPATPDEESWHNYRRQSQQETPKRLEEAAKYLSGLVSVVFAIFFSTETGVFQKTADAAMTGLICIVWTAALAAGVAVRCRHRAGASGKRPVQIPFAGVGRVAFFVGDDFGGWRFCFSIKNLR